MPEIKHVGSNIPPAPAPEQPPAVPVSPAETPNPKPAPPPEETQKAVASTAGVTPEIERLVESILNKRRVDVVKAQEPVEPDWATLSEKDIYTPGVYIPTVEHQLPDYMNMKLKDAEYEVVWASRDQRRLGQLQAEGYEILRKEHVHPDFKLPLLFDSENMYTYMDVVAMRVHKRILYSKRRKVVSLTREQIRRTAKDLPSNKHDGLESQLTKGIEIYQVESIVG